MSVVILASFLAFMIGLSANWWLIRLIGGNA